MRGQVTSSGSERVGGQEKSSEGRFTIDTSCLVFGVGVEIHFHLEWGRQHVLKATHMQHELVMELLTSDLCLSISRNGAVIVTVPYWAIALYNNKH